METTRRGFLTGIVGTSLLGLFWPEKLKQKATQMLPAPLKEDTPHMPFTPLPDQQPKDPWATEPLRPAPHESPGSFCPFNGTRYTEGQCPCALCSAARAKYWRELEERARQQRNGWSGATTASTGYVPLWVTAGTIGGYNIAPGTYPVSGTVTMSNSSTYSTPTSSGVTDGND